MKPKVLYGADFETTTILGENLTEENIKNKKLEVWLAGFQRVTDAENREKIKIQTSIKDFFIELIEDIFTIKSTNEVVIFFHNLKFDGSYILNYLNYKEIPYETFINDMGQWYSITIEVEGYKIEFRDSLKIMNFSLSQIGKKVLNSKVLKGETPLLENKPKKIKIEWIEYIKTDIQILSLAIKGLYFKENFTKFTSASESLKEFKEILGINFRALYPLLDEEIDKILRKGYRGGWTYANPKYREKEIVDDIVVYDKNSMYPAIMLNYFLPYGKPKIYDKYIEKKKNHLYVYDIEVSFDLKDNHLPTIQIKDFNITNMLNKKLTDYLETSNNMYLPIVVTEYDLELIKKHYHYQIIYKNVYEFKAKKGVFDSFINHFSKQKIDGKKTNDYIKTQKAKLMLNSLYGKLGSRVEQRQKETYFENDVLKFTSTEKEKVAPIYLPVALFITSIGRYEVITDAQNNFKHFLYSDTDSIHLINHDNINLPVDKYKFGYWDLEYRAFRGKYLRSKLYIEELENKDLVIRGAGMTSEVKKQVTFENFKIGAVYHGKHASKQVKGGVLIYKNDFTIKDLNI